MIFFFYPPAMHPRSGRKENEIANNRGLKIFMPSLINIITFDALTRFTPQN